MRNLVRTLACYAGLVLTPSMASAQARDIGCSKADISAIAQHYGVQDAILHSIMQVEGGRVGVVTKNRNNTTDHGPMQINSVHFARISSLTGLPQAEVRRRLTNDGCWNIGIGAWLLASHIQRTGGDLWSAVGDYHSKTDKHGNRYMSKVVRAARDIYGPDIFAAPAR